MSPEHKGLGNNNSQCREISTIGSNHTFSPFLASSASSLIHIDTNLHKAIIAGVRMLRDESDQNVRPDENVVSMLIVLSDGNPNHGEIDKEIIERNVEEEIRGDFSLFNLGFGEDLDFPFLERMAYQVCNRRTPIQH